VNASPQLLTFRDHCRKQADHTRAIASDAVEELADAGPEMWADLSACIERALKESLLWTSLADEIDTSLPELAALDDAQEGLFA
jgi:hypothetical protein